VCTDDSVFWRLATDSVTSASDVFNLQTANITFCIIADRRRTYKVKISTNANIYIILANVKYQQHLLHIHHSVGMMYVTGEHIQVAIVAGK